MKPALRYFGSKWSIADWIIAQLPPHVCYVEVFGGSAAVLLSKPRSSHEVYNDINGDVVELFEVLRDRPDALARAIALTPFSREERLRSLTPEEDLDQVDRVRRFLVRSWQTRGGGRRTAGKGSWAFAKEAIGGSNHARVWANLPGRLVETAQRLRGIYIERDDWRRVLERYDAPGTLFYLDPPYLAEVRGAKYEYAIEMGEAEHVEMLWRLACIKGMALVSGYASALYDERLSGWERVETTTRAQTGAPRTEVLWLSPSASRNARQHRLDFEVPA